MKIKRVKKMEAYFDEVLLVLEKEKMTINRNVDIKEKIQTLRRYQESGQWLKDYESDERGEFPSDLKRGVLSQDGLYNLLIDVDNILKCEEE